MFKKPHSSILRAVGLFLFLFCPPCLNQTKASCYDEIVRVSNATAYGLKQGIVEFPIGEITYLHEVPNPKRKDHPPDFLEQLMEKIRIEGFQEKYAVPLLRMPDGIVYCLGHHRTEAMKRLGQRTIPAIVHEWKTLPAATREFAIEEYPQIFSRYK